MKEASKMIKLMEKEFIPLIMVKDMKEISPIMNVMETEYFISTMVIDLKENLLKVKHQEFIQEIYLMAKSRKLLTKNNFIW